MSRIVSGIITLRQHIATLRSTPKSTAPRVSELRAWHLRHHGCSLPQGGSPPGDPGEYLNPIPIPRYLCASCRHSCSRLPECLAPRRWDSWVLQQQALQALLTVYSLHGCSTTHGLCRSTVRRWWIWLSSSTVTFEFFLRSRYPEWGRTSDWQSFWRTCLNEMPLSGIMANLDHDGIDVP